MIAEIDAKTKANIRYLSRQEICNAEISRLTGVSCPSITQILGKTHPNGINQEHAKIGLCCSVCGIYFSQKHGHAVIEKICRDHLENKGRPNSLLDLPLSEYSVIDVDLQSEVKARKLDCEALFTELKA